MKRSNLFLSLLLCAAFIAVYCFSGCGGGTGGVSPGSGNNSGSASSVSTDSPTSLTDKDGTGPHYLYLKIAYTLDNGEVITYELDPGTLSAVTTQKSQSSPKNSYLSDILQSRAPGGAWRITYDKATISLSDDDMNAYITDRFVGTKDAYSFGPGPNIAEEYIVCPEPSIYPERNTDREGVTVIPDPISKLGPITYSPSSPSFSGGFHIVANYVVPDEPGRPPKPWHESWDYYYDLNSPTPVLFRYFNGGGHWTGAEITLGLGSQKDSDEDSDDGDVPFPPLPRTLAPWRFVQNSNLSHVDEVINMRELSIKNAFVTPAQDFPNKVKIEAELEGLPEGTWQPENVRGECEIVNLDTQEKTTMDLDWNSSKLLLAGYFTFPAAVVAVYGSMMQSLLENGVQYSYTMLAYADTEKTFVIAGAVPLTLTIEDLKITPVKTDGTYLADFVYPDKVDKPALYPACDEQYLKFDGNIKVTGKLTDLKWNISIINKKNSNIKVDITGNGSTIDSKWYGKYDGSSSGAMVPMGEYYFKITATCAQGVKASTKNIESYLGPPLVAVQPYYQTDYPAPSQLPPRQYYYKYYLNNNPKHKIYDKGCLLCDFSMILKKHGIKLFYQDEHVEDPDPLNLNKWLREEHAYSETQYGYEIDERAAIQISSDRSFNHNVGRPLVIFARDRGEGVAEDLGYNCDYSLGHPAIIKIGPLGAGYTAHGVVAIGECRSSDPNKFNFKINDPLNRHSTLEQYYNEENYFILGTYRIKHTSDMQYGYDYSALYFKASSFVNTSPEFEFAPFSVIELCLTDPLNRKTGYDTSTQKVVEEVPNSIYSISGDGMSEYGILTKTLDVDKLISGEYKLEVIGIKEGGYSIYTGLCDRRDVNNRKIIRGTRRITSPGTIHSYKIIFDRDDINNSSITKVISPGELNNSLQTTFNLRWIDSRGILNSLTKKLENAESAIARGQTNAAVNELNAFINEVKAQSGKHIAQEAADIFIDDAKTLIKQLQK